MGPLILILALAAAAPAAEPASPATPPAAQAPGAHWKPLRADDERLAAIKANAALVIETLRPLSKIDFGYNQASVAWVDGFIERQRARPGMSKGKMPDVLGSYLGEAIIARTGGEWAMSDEYGLGVRLPNGAWAFPFNKVNKQWDQGNENGESVLGFYTTTIDMVATGRLNGG